MPILQVDNLRTFFRTDAGEARAVDGVSFHVDAGETLGIVGESGCGKTVTALSIMGLVPRPPGRILEGSSIRLNGEELVGAPERRLRQIRGSEISMVFQEPMTSLNPVYTVGEQVAEVLRAHRDLNKVEARARAVDLLDEVGIPDPGRRFDDFPHQLSGGMRQRVMIAMALSCEPSVLIADEPTTALDVTIQAQILRLLSRLTTDRAMAVMLVTHDLGVVAQTCDRMVVMYAGQVVESGSVASVFAEPRHPYTRGLLRSVPRPDRPERRLTPISGSVPSPTAWPPACRFQDRCPDAFGRCSAEAPVLVDDAAGRVRCWLAAPGPAGATES